MVMKPPLGARQVPWRKIPLLLTSLFKMQ